MEPLQVIAAPRRLRILELVWDRERSAGDIAAQFDVSWSAISQHLTVLRTAGFLLERREGNSRLYRADQAALGPLRAVVEQHWRAGLEPGQGPRRVRAADPGPRVKDADKPQADALEVSIHIAAQPETVFPYFTDPARYVQWMGSDADLEPVPGGTYRVRMRDGVETVGQFLEVDPPRRLVFTWGWTQGPPVPPGSTRVVVTLEPEAGGTRVVLRHHDLPDDEQRQHHTTGWAMYLARLALLITGADPGPDPNA